MAERRASAWNHINEDCNYCYTSYREATKPTEYRRPQRELRAAITRGMQIERDALRQEILAVKREVRQERTAARKPRYDFDRRAREIGLDPDTMWDLYQAHDRHCEICGVHEDDLDQRLSMDHCHSTGAFRGFLCAKCNSGIGLLGDTADAVAKALKYLENR